MDGDDNDDTSFQEEEENLVTDENEPQSSPRFRNRVIIESANENEDNDRQKSVLLAQKLYNNSCAYLLFRSTLICGLGYRMDNFRDSQQMDTKHKINLEYETQGLAVGVNIGKMTCHGAQIVGIVKPLVRVHLVSIETGLYIKSKKLPPTVAVTTRPCALKNSMEYPSWTQELILDANYCDVASEDALLLFEILDDKPSLSPQQRNKNNESNVPTAKRVAWAYLLPIGMRGELNIGLSDDWKTSNRNAKNISSRTSSPTKNRKNATGDGTDASNKETTDNGSEEVDGEDTLSALPSDRPRSPLKQQQQNGEDEQNLRISTNSVQQQQNKRNYPWNKRSADLPLRLQLHFYREYDGAVGFAQRRLRSWPVLAHYQASDASAYPNGIPEVYLQWRLQRRLPVNEGFLTVSLGPRPGELMSVSPMGAPMDGIMRSPSKDRGGLLESEDVQSLGHLHGSSKRSGKHQLVKTKAELARMRAAVLKRSRGAREPCVVPDKLLYRMDVGPEGAMVVAFSQSGHLLAVCAKAPSTSVSLSNQAVIYSLRLFDTDSNEEVWSEDAAHHGVVYEAKWSKDDRYLLTCSGDGTSKVWDLLGLLFRVNALQQTTSLATNKQPPSSPTERAMDRSVVSESNASLQGLLSSRQTTPALLHTLISARPVFVYTGVFQETSSAANTIKATFSNASVGLSGTNNLYSSTDRFAEAERSPLPRIITGSSDGRLRVWDGAQMAGYVCVKDKEAVSEGGQEQDLSPHEGQVNSIVIDERSKYMITADSAGDILAWRCDVKGWYQLLRKFKRDSPGPTQTQPSGQSGLGGVLSLVMHPDKSRGQMLALSKHPAQLRMYNMSTYKVQSLCAGYVGMSTTSAGGGAFSRAALSADGRYVISGSSLSVHSSQYRLQVWDSQTGHAVKTPLSDYLFPYPIRAVSWHPKQHLLAIAMVGSDAAVAVYVGDRDSADKSSSRLETNNQGGGGVVDGESTGPFNTFSNTLDTVRFSILDESLVKSAAPSSSAEFRSVPGNSSSLALGGPKQSVISEQQQQRIALLGGGPAGKMAASDATTVTSTGDEEQARLLKSKKAKEMLSRLKKAKADKALNEQN